jgi:phospholipid transport system substrate-binding protein
MSSLLRRAMLAMLVALPLMIPAARSFADAPKDAGDFVSGVVQSAIKILADKGMSAPDRDRGFSQLLNANFDVPRIARFVLGRYWATASDADKNSFIDTYREYVIRSYATRFADYSGETVKVTTARAESDNVTIVNSDIVHPNGDPPVKVAWRVYKGPDGFKIIDVDVEGVSMMVTQREEFAAVIQRSGGTVPGLTQAIQQKMKGG